jgi:hypothetical protein
MKVNLNDSVNVTLTKVGAEILTEHYKSLSRFGGADRTFTEGDSYRGQLWCLIGIFKSQIGLGLRSPFENCEILIEVDNSEG